MARVLVLVENYPVPSDRRVWNEISALREAGHEVTAISPRGGVRDPEPFAEVEGVAIHRFEPAESSGGALGFVREYAMSLLRIRRLVRRLGREAPFDVVHAANPPDLLLLTALSQRRRGARLVFDHHDLAPELYLARFDRGRDPFYWLSRVAERLTFRLADVVLSANDSYRAIALGRGHKAPEDVFVVRSAPALSRFVPLPEDPELRAGKAHLLVYIGEMGPQDGIDLALEALAALYRRRDDWRAVFAGDGDVVGEMRARADELGIGDRVEFCGFLMDRELRTLLSTADVGLVPDPKTPLSDASTLVKVAEYLAMSRPVVAFDLTETRITAGDAALYASDDDPEAFADAIARLLDDPGLRRRMGEQGRRRVQDGLTWEHSARQVVAAYERALRPRGGRRARRSRG